MPVRCPPKTYVKVSAAEWASERLALGEVEDE